MDPTLAASLAGAGGNTVSAGLDALTTGVQNRASRKFSKQMYERQYNDNIKFWQMQNEYNSPQAQMQRFQQAGLNPNLIYGRGDSGNAGQINTPDVQPVQNRVPDFSSIGRAGEALSQGILERSQNYEIRQAQLDGLKLDNETKAITNVTKRFEQQITGIKYNRDQYGWEQNLHQTQADASRADLQQKYANLQYTLDENQRKAVMQSGNLKEQLQRIMTMQESRAKSQEERKHIQQSVKNLQKDEQLKQIEIEMRDMGWTPGSPAWMGVLTRFFNLLMQR